MLKITGGKYKGFKILCPKGNEVRPTLAKTREALFNVICSRFDLSEYSAIDLFAGSGALGFEAISRGADNVTFIETNKLHCEYLKKNVKKLQVLDQCEVHCTDAIRWLGTLTSAEKPMLFLLDPPYDTPLLEKSLDIITEQIANLPGSLLMLELPKNKEIAYPDKFKVFQQKKFGKTKLDFIQIVEDD